VRAAQELLGGAPTIGGGVPGQAWWWRESKSNKPSKPPEIDKNSRFPALIDLKIAKSAIFFLKVLNKIYSLDVF
jgi:hypothetical protein